LPKINGARKSIFIIHLIIHHHTSNTLRMETVPSYVSIAFMLTTILTVAIFYKATSKSMATLAVLAGWLALQGFVARTGFYTVTNTIPPRFLLAVLPPLVFVILLFVTSKGRHFIDSLDTKTLTLLHTIRIPVEIGLYWLFANKAIPQLMTFEGRNFDILSGVTAPLVYYFGFIKKTLSRKAIIAWNIVCLGLLINIVVNAFLSAPFPFQQFAFDQPNIAVLHFPFIWLPCCIVPIVLLSHLAAIRHLRREEHARQIVA
jgi:hypothetical protein